MRFEYDGKDGYSMPYTKKQVRDLEKTLADYTLPPDAPNAACIQRAAAHAATARAILENDVKKG